MHAVGEHAAGLQSVVAWQPNGRHLYAPVQQQDGALRMLLFERNGLQHGCLDVPGPGKLFPHWPIPTPPVYSAHRFCWMCQAYKCLPKWSGVAAGRIASMHWSPDSECLALVLSLEENATLNSAGHPISVDVSSDSAEALPKVHCVCKELLTCLTYMLLLLMIPMLCGLCRCSGIVCKCGSAPIGIGT